jgi:hypothetical protein
MGKHANKKIVDHIDNSEELLEKMHLLTGKLSAALEKNFEETMGCKLPSIILAKVRVQDVVFAFATDPKLDEYVNGARKVVSAAFAEEKQEIVNGMLDIVEVVARNIIGSGEIKVGIHNSAAHTGHYVTAASAVVQKASAKDWATSADFFVSFYTFVVFRPSRPQKSLLMARPILKAAAPERAVDFKSLAAKNYTYHSLPA